MTGNNIDNPHFVASHDFHGDAEYVAWLQEIKARYQRIRSRVALQANYGALEFNWQLGRDLVEKKAEQKWGAGVVEQLSLDLRAAYPDVKGFSSRNLWYMKQWYLFYSGNSVQTEKLHRLGAELQSIENQNPVKLHQRARTSEAYQVAGSTVRGKREGRFNIVGRSFGRRWYIVARA